MCPSSIDNKSAEVDNWFWPEQEAKTEKKSYNPGQTVVNSGINRGSSISFVDHLQSSGLHELAFQQMVAYYKKCSPLSNAIDLIAEGGASIQPIVVDRKTKKTVDHDIIGLLEYPNSNMDWADFCKDALSMQLITNNPFLDLIGDTNRPPVALDIVRPHVIQMEPDRVGDLGQITKQSEFLHDTYESEDVLGRSRFRNKSQDGEIWPMSGFNPERGTRNFFAPSKIQSLYEEVEQYIMGNTHNSSLLANGARPGGVFSTESGAPPLSDKQFDRAQDQITRNYRGAHNAGNPLLLEWMKYTETIINNRDMDYSVNKNDVRNSIYRRYNTPLALVDSKAMTYSNFGNASAALYTMAIIPSINYFFKQLKNGLMYRYGSDWERYDLTFDPSTIPALVAQMVEDTKNKSATGVYQVNELRTGVFLDPMVGGDVILRPANDVPALDNEEDDYDNVDNVNDSSGSSADADNEVNRGKKPIPSDDLE